MSARNGAILRINDAEDEIYFFTVSNNISIDDGEFTKDVFSRTLCLMVAGGYDIAGIIRDIDFVYAKFALKYTNNSCRLMNYLNSRLK